MASVRPEMKFATDFVGLQGIEELAAVAVGEVIVGGVAEEGRGAARAGEQAGIFVILEKIGRIDEGAEVRAAGDLVDGILRWIVAFISGGGGEGGEVASCGESHDAQLAGIEPDAGSLAAEQAEGTLRVLQGWEVAHGVLALARQPVFEDPGMVAEPAEKAGDLGALEIPCENVITSAGTNDDAFGGRFRFFLRREIGEDRIGDVFKGQSAAHVGCNFRFFGAFNFPIPGKLALPSPFLPRMNQPVRPAHHGRMGGVCSLGGEQAEEQQGEDGTVPDHMSVSVPERWRGWQAVPRGAFR